MAKGVIVPEKLIEALRAAGIATDDTRRVVIDIKAGEVPIVYVEQFGDKKLLAVVEALSETQIERK